MIPTPHPRASVDQFQVDHRAEMEPADPDARRSWARLVATDATIYGLPSVYQYAQMHAQAVAPDSPRYSGFDRFRHQRDLAGPDFDDFLTPNVDTLYSNAWLDLTRGPALVSIPAMGSRYYTLQFCDAYANATNLSSRTVGPDGGRFLVAPPGWEGQVPTGVELFRVGSRYMWILMRIALGRSGDDLDHVRTLQDATTIEGSSQGGPPPQAPAVTATSVEHDWRDFFRALDWSIRANGHTVEDAALVHRFRAIGVGGAEAFDPDGLDPVVRQGVADGFTAGMTIIAAARPDFGEQLATGWMTGTVGDNGFNVLRRAVQNFVGTGGNVSEEKRFFVTFQDADGETLDGSTHRYRLVLPEPPPVDGHWSLTMYDAATRRLHPNPIERYAISPWTPGLRYEPDGSLEVVLAADEPASGNWLPAPAAPFYVDIRTWQPRAEVRSCAWLPGPVRPLTDRST